LLVDKETCIENITPLREKYNFIPNTSIKILLEETKQYALQTIGAIVTTTKILGTQYTLEINYGNSENDKAMVRVSPYKHLEIIKKLFPLHLFSITKNKIIYALLKVQLQLFPTFTLEISFIEEHLSKREFSILLFRNSVKQKEATSNTLHTGQSTYIGPLTTKKHFEYLRLLLKWTNQVKFLNHLKKCYHVCTFY